MKASELIICIQRYIEIHGDIPISITLAGFGDNLCSEFEDIHVGYDQRSKGGDYGDTIDIRNFTY